MPDDDKGNLEFEIEEKKRGSFKLPPTMWAWLIGLAIIVIPSAWVAVKYIENNKPPEKSIQQNVKGDIGGDSQPTAIIDSPGTTVTPKSMGNVGDNGIAIQADKIGNLTINITPPAPTKEVKERVLRSEERRAQARMSEALRLYDLGLTAYNENIFDKSADYFEQALKILDTPDFHLAAASAYFSLNQFKESEQHGRAALAQVDTLERDDREEMRARALGTIANAQCGAGSWSDARESCVDSLLLFRKLARARPKVYLPFVAITCSNLGNLLADLGERVEARKLFEEALNINRELAQAEPKAYLPYVATTYNNLGTLLAQMGERPEARQLFEEALNIYRALAQAQPKAYLPYVAGTCNNLGALLAQMGERPEARQLYQEALKIYRELAQSQPQAYLPDVAMTCNNLGALLAQMGERPEARQLYQEALKIYRELAQSQPYLPDVATTCNNLGLLLLEMGENEKAEALLEEARDIREKM